MSFYVDMISVGEADALVLALETNSGRKQLLIDGGRNGGSTASPRPDREVRSYLETCLPGKALDAIICTHMDGDHVGGLLGVVGERDSIGLTIGAVITNPHALAASPEMVRLSQRAAGAAGMGVQNVIISSIGQQTKLLELLPESIPALPGLTGLDIAGLLGEDWAPYVLPIHSPEQADVDAALAEAEIQLSAVQPATTASNNASVVFTVNSPAGCHALFPGDADYERLSEAFGGAVPPYAFLKVPHHGSECRLEYAEEVLAPLANGAAFISAKGDNDQLPAESVMSALSASGAEVFRSWSSPGTIKTPFVTRYWRGVRPGDCGGRPIIDEYPLDDNFGVIVFGDPD